MAVSIILSPDTRAKAFTLGMNGVIGNEEIKIPTIITTFKTFFNFLPIFFFTIFSFQLLVLLKKHFKFLSSPFFIRENRNFRHEKREIKLSLYTLSSIFPIISF